MLKIDYDENCAYKPSELGLHIAQMLTNKNIKQTFKFLMFQDRVVKNEDGMIDNSKHSCMLFMLDDIENSETNLKSMNDIAVFLLQDKNIQIECKEDEGLAMLIDDNMKHYDAFGDSADQRIRFMLLDDKKFSKFIQQAKIGITDIDRFEYNEKDGYYCILRINENGLNQFKENGLDYHSICLKEETAFVMRFVKKHWPEEQENMKISTDLIDTGKIVYDEEENVNRHIWKFMFRLYDSAGNEIKGDYAINISR